MKRPFPDPVTLYLAGLASICLLFWGMGIAFFDEIGYNDQTNKILTKMHYDVTGLLAETRAQREAWRVDQTDHDARISDRLNRLEDHLKDLSQALHQIR